MTGMMIVIVTKSGDVAASEADYRTGLRLPATPFPMRRSAGPRIALGAG